MAECSICPTNASLGYILLGWLLGRGMCSVDSGGNGPRGLFRIPPARTGQDTSSAPLTQKLEALSAYLAGGWDG